MEAVTAAHEIAKDIESFQPVIDAYTALITEDEVETEEDTPTEGEGDGEDEEVDKEAKERARLAAIEAKKEAMKEEKESCMSSCFRCFHTDIYRYQSCFISRSDCLVTSMGH